MTTSIAVTLCSLFGALLLVMAVLTLGFPVVAAYWKALIRRDRGWAFVPHSRQLRSRIAAAAYIGTGLVLLLAFQPRPFRLPTGAYLVPVGGPPDPVVAAEVAPLIETGQCLGLVVGIVDASGRRTWGYGRARIDGPPVDAGTIFEIGALTHPFTTLILARMIETEQARFDQPVRELLPDSVSVPAFGLEPILLEHLATHRSGLPSQPPGLGAALLDACPPYADPWSGFDAERLYRFLSSYDLERAPGARIEFSDLGVGLLGHALERVAGAGYDTLARREVTEPLRMTDTGVRLDPAARPRLALGYRPGRWSYRGWALASPAHPWRYRAVNGAGGLHSTATDLLTFLSAQLHLESAELQPAMDFTREPRYRGGERDAVGLGWRIRLGDGNEEPMVWASGATGGQRAWMGMIESRGIGVVVLANSPVNVDALGQRLLRRFATGQ